MLVSRLGFGCAAMGGYDYGPVDDRESTSAVHRALDCGVNFFDTADVYGFGHAEDVLRRALGSRRHDVVIATKFGIAWDDQGRTRRDSSPKWLQRALEDSLRRLGIDRVPLYQVHWPDEHTPIAETLEALIKFQRAGKIGLIGLCNVSAAFVAEAQQLARIETIQLPYSVLDRERESDFVECRRRHGMGVLTYDSLGHGLLAGKYGSTTQFIGTDLRNRSEKFRGAALESGLAAVERIQAVGAHYDRSPAQVAIRWVLQTLPNAVVLAGVKRASQMGENAGAFGWTVSDNDLLALSAAAGVERECASASEGEMS